MYYPTSDLIHFLIYWINFSWALVLSVNQSDATVRYVQGNIKKNLLLKINLC